MDWGYWKVECIPYMALGEAKEARDSHDSISLNSSANVLPTIAAPVSSGFEVSIVDVGNSILML